MSQSCVYLFVHVIWATKDKYPFFSKPMKNRVHCFIRKMAKEKGINLVAIDGTEDHVHLLVRMRGEQALSDIVRVLKAHSSKFINEVGGKETMFSWQAGYGGFSVSPSMVNKIRKYILKQEEHHKHVYFEEELKTLYQL